MKAWELLSSPERWTQHVTARDSNDVICLEDDGKACSWCIIGALRKCYQSLDRELSVWRDITVAIGNQDVADWNDAPERTHAEVLEILKRLDV